ncbi:MAG: beta-ketoacyl synthase N-terminal-like domain-containing protein [Bacteroidetes bacterium]|nr:beta-ketoacyl synthase N-terminal-like domain-containing protein [Bacteroidota bacterium]
MSRKAFITGYCLRAPGINSDTDLYETLVGGRFNPVFTSIEIAENYFTEVGLIDFGCEDRFLPKASLQKTMRPDVLASCICISELMEKYAITREEAESMPLFVANGVTLEPVWEENNAVHAAFYSENHPLHKAEKQAILYQSFPPLSALRTLTNATESFISQVSGLAGNNVTFGSTSLSGFYTLQEGVRRIKRGECKRVIVGGSFFAGIFSNLSFKNFAPDSRRRESTVAVYLLLESEEKRKERGNHGGYFVHEMKSLARVAPVDEKPNGQPYVEMVKHCQPGPVLYSGGLTGHSFQEESEVLQTTRLPQFSWFPFLGHLGAVSMLMNVITGISLLGCESAAMVNCLDRDPYGRESLAVISKEIE